MITYIINRRLLHDINIIMIIMDIDIFAYFMLFLFGLSFIDILKIINKRNIY